MPAPPPLRRRAKPGSVPPSIINRCNAFNLLLSLGIMFLVFRAVAHPGSAEPAVTPYPEKLDPELIDEAAWPERPGPGDCAFVASYGPGGANSSRALLLRGGARAWPVVDRASLRSLVRMYPNTWGTVTVAPSKTFTLFTNSTEQQYADAHLSADQVPAKLINMPLKRFQAHMQPSRLRRRLKNLYYQDEHYYWSGQPPEGLGHRPDEPPLSCLTLPSQETGQERLFITTARLRVTARDSVHIMHYDTSPSLLVQVKGRKLVTLVPASQMAYTYPYARGHLLFRRSRVELLHPDYEKYPLARKLKPTELVMSPGDVLVFPKDTCHQTRVLTDNVSMSFRFKNAIRW